jgi:acetylornithine deacetylase
VPAECSASIRVGFFPGTPIAAARAEVEAALDAVASAKHIQYQVRYFGFAAEGCEIDAECELLKGLGRAHSAITGAAAKYAPVTCTTDVRHFQLYYGIPATCYGPEYTRNIHGIDESVSIDAVVTVVAVLARFIVDWCGVEG